MNDSVGSVKAKSQNIN